MKTFTSCLIIVGMLGTLGTVHARTVDFSGVVWEVKQAYMGPGPNQFSDSPENVWVDEEGRLHLKITYRDGTWHCAEVWSQESFGYGTYQFFVESRIDKLDKNVVVGLFTYETDEREIDIEFARWGNPTAANAQFVVQPYFDSETTPDNIARFDIALSGTHSTHSVVWKPDSIAFQSAHGHYAAPPDTHIINSWRYDGPDVPPAGNAKAHLNVWLQNQYPECRPDGPGYPPSDGQEVEIIITEFVYIPLDPLEAAKGLNAVDRIKDTPITDVFAGDMFTYTITITNWFDQAVSLVIEDALDAYLTYITGSFAVNGGTTADPVVSDRQLRYESSTLLGQSESLSISFDVEVGLDAFPNTIIANSALITAVDQFGTSLGSVETNVVEVQVVEPIPEPATLIFFGAGLLIVLELKRRRSHWK